MGLSERSGRSLGTIVGHAEHVCSVAEGATPPPGIEAASSSWQRSAKKYGLDPIDSKAPRILTPAELKYFREPCPPPPRTIPRRAKFPKIRTPLPGYVRRDARLRRPSYHRTRRCSGAPVFGVDGRLIAVLDVSAIDPELSERAHALTGALTVRSARAIEERFFREQFRREWIVAVAPPEGGGAGMLLAIDGNQRIVGANRVARTSLMLDDRGPRAGIS